MVYPGQRLGAFMVVMMLIAGVGMVSLALMITMGANNLPDVQALLRQIVEILRQFKT